LNTLKPKCFGRMEAAVNAQGFLLPCCWCDTPKTLNDINFKKLVNSKFHLSKVKDIKEVLYSNEWKEFRENLKKNNVNKLPDMCKIKCKDGL